MKKIIILVNHDLVIYNFRRKLVKRLLQEGYDVYISSPYGERIDYLISMGCKFINTKVARRSTNILQDLKLLLFYTKIIKEIKPDVVLTYTIKPNIYGGIACQLRGIPYIANITGLGTAVEYAGVLQKVTTLLYKIAFRKIQCLFFQNEENQHFFLDNNIAIGKHNLIPGSGVNLEHFKLLEYPSENTIEFAFISRIMKQKGIDQYLEAAKFIKQRYPKTKFHICGFCEDAYEEKLKQLQHAGIIEYHGMLSDVRTILRRIHCTIHPTYYPEGMSNVLLESAACGRPIITTDRSGCREIVDDGINGYVVKQRNSQDLIEKIEMFIKLSYNEKKQMGLAGRSKVEKEFDRRTVIDAYIKEIDTIISK